MLTRPHYLGITKRQRDVLDFVSGYISRNGNSPCYDEIAEAIGIKSKSRIHYILCALEERGAVTRLPNKSRSIVPVGITIPDRTFHVRLPEKIEAWLVARAKRRGVTAQDELVSVLSKVFESN